MKLKQAKEEVKEEDGYYDDGVCRNHKIVHTYLNGRIFDAYLADEGKVEILKKHPDLESYWINRVGVEEVKHC